MSKHTGRVWKKLAVALFLCFVLLEFKELVWRRPTVSSTLEEMLQNALLKAAKEKKVILIWQTNISSSNISSSRIDFVVNNADMLYPKESCGLCEITTNTSKIRERSTSAVLFEYNHVTPELMPPPDHRRTDQLYIWWTKESPVNMMYNKKDNLYYADTIHFNATMTHRRDSDIYSPYGRTVDLLHMLERNLSTILNSKTKLAVALISNCDRMPGARVRLDYLQRINASGFKVDTLGKCFGAEVGKKSRRFYARFLKQYKFYFAFENSYHCRDYITEKVFRNSIQSNSVPVVWGATREDYEAFLPPNSYIHLEDFASLKDLTDYLNYLDRNDSAYMEYFRWRTKAEKDYPEYNQKVRYCQLCRILHGINVDDLYSTASSNRPPFTDTVAPRTVQSLSKWFYGTENKECMHEIKDIMP